MGLLGPKQSVLHRGRGHQFIGISNVKNQIIVTYSDNITIYDAVGRKVTKSWTARPGQHLTSPTIHNAAENEFVVVINSNIIKTFTEDFDKGHKFSVPSPVHCIVPAKEPLVVFGSGIVASLSDVLSAPERKLQDGPISSSASIIHFIDVGQRYFIVCDNKIYYLMLEGLPGVKLTSGTLNLVSVCHRVEDEGFLLITFWSDGSLCLSTINRMSILEGNIVMKKVFSVPAPQVNQGNKLMALLDDRLVALAAGNNEIRVLDLKYGVTHEYVQVSEVHHLIAIGAHLVVVNGESVVIYSFSSPSVALSKVVGKNLSIDLPLLQCGSWCDSLKHKPSKSNDDVTYIEVLLSSHKKSELEDAWNALWLSKTPSERHALASSPFLRKFLRKLTNSKEPWFESLMRKVISDSTISARMCDGLVEGIIDRKEWKLLPECLIKIKDISENELFKCLESVLPTEPGEMSPHTREIISIATALPVTEDKLVDALRGMNLNKAMVLLLHLGTNLKESEIQSAPNVDKTLTWICALLDAHFTQIIVTPSAWKFLLEVREIVSILVELYDNLSDIEVILSKMMEATKGTRDRTRFFYKIEIMTV